MSRMVTNNLGERIRERRKAKGWTLAQVSQASGVSTSYLGRVEGGQRFPSGHILKRLAEPLGFTEDELLKLALRILGDEPTDDSDGRIEVFKRQIKAEIADALVVLYKKIDSF